MTKTQKLRDKQIRHALTTACESIKHSYPGFAYLTHTIDFKNETKSLKVKCYFADDTAYHESETHLNQITDIITAELGKINLPITAKQISFLVD
ncbi:hypothetical protein CWC11_13135 [Pseudoalteromonas sp. S3178]|uniref:hypothetical protein n=1 Tax=Pseudoalteromonas sp. S3178 TaxID=579532 RepID=UPI00110AF147|nr:hypothetical protein [Pseudoalteromonas sp. S3178]TMP03734.1 hypothetical protein CWC11_13135 [Pseudoalteromonas sp. S3178]